MNFDDYLVVIQTMKRQTPEMCAYCGGTEDLTDEHAPPKLVFPEPRPSDLITVRACRKCNEAGSKDAEYFRVCLCLNPSSRDTPNVIALKPTVQRSMDRPQAAGFRNSILNALSPAEDGQIAFSLEMRRLHSVINRTVQCLYLHETRVRLPNTHQASAFSEEVFQHFERARAREFQETYVLPLAQQDPKIIAEGQFAYSVIHMPRPFMSAWGLLFYGALPYVVLTGPRVR